MSEKGNEFQVDRELLDFYKITPFHLDQLKYSMTANCNEAVHEWKSAWPSCPVCGGSFDENLNLVHKSPLKDAH